MVTVYNIGVLALQGAVTEHINSIFSLGHQGTAIKTKDQLSQVDGLIIPGGESTAIGKLMVTYGFIESIRDFASQGKPIFGTCAGMALMAKAYADNTTTYLDLMDITVRRNAFGRQRESFELNLEIAGLDSPFPAVFIRAPYAESAGVGVEVLGKVDEKIVCARQDNFLVCSFHPELTDDDRMLKMFINMF